MKYDFIVHPGGDPKDIQIQYNGATSLSLKDGALTAATPLGSIIENAPYCYERKNEKQVSSGFVLKDNTLGFDIAAYEGTLVIDPQLEWATYYGGQDRDVSMAVMVDERDNVYMAGETRSLKNISTTGAYRDTMIGYEDMFLVCFDVLGNRQWGTYFGGERNDYLQDGIMGNDGTIYTLGFTTSTKGIATKGAYKDTLDNGYDAFLIKFDTNGNRIWGTYFGGMHQDYGEGLACDRENNVYISGGTYSKEGIASVNSHQATLGGLIDGFVAKFGNDGRYIWSTYYGGKDYDDLGELAIDANGNVFAAGGTISSDAVVTPGSHQNTFGGGTHSNNSYWGDGLLVKFNKEGKRLWATYYGGNKGDVFWNLTCDDIGSVYLCGITMSDNNIASSNCFQSAMSDTVGEGFIVKFNGDGIRQWGTYYGGSSVDYIIDLDINSWGDLIVVGRTSSTDGIASPNSWQQYSNGKVEGILSKFDVTHGMRLWGSYLGGSGVDAIQDVVCTYNGAIYVAGYSDSSLYFVTPNSHQDTISRLYDAYLAKLIDDSVVYINRPFDQVFHCPGDTFSVAYTTLTSLTSPATFTVQLSDSLGSFITATPIGLVQTMSSGVIHCKIPANQPSGDRYRIRIVSEAPLFTSSDNGIDIRIHPLAEVTTVATNSPVCEGDTLLLSVNSSLQGLGCEWNGPGGFFSNIQDAYIEAIDSDLQGIFRVRVQYGNCVLLDSVVVVVKVPPVISASNNGPLNPGRDLLLSVTSNTAGMNYLWAGPDSFAYTGDKPVIKFATAKNAGIYTVLVSDSVCKTAAFTTVQINDNGDNYFVLFPNPNNGRFSIRGALKLDQNITMVVINSIGQEIFSSKAVTNQKLLDHSIILPPVAAGTYFLNLTVGGKIMSIPFTVEQ